MIVFLRIPISSALINIVRLGNKRSMIYGFRMR